VPDGKRVLPLIMPLCTHKILLASKSRYCRCKLGLFAAPDGSEEGELLLSIERVLTLCSSKECMRTTGFVYGSPQEVVKVSQTN
jgi:hypothetical protein